MANTNTKISTLVSSQLPGFVRDDNPLFVAFMEAYYEYLEQNVGDTGSTGTGKVIQRLKSIRDNFDIEKSMDDFSAILYNQFMQFIPQNSDTQVDFKKLLPQIKDFYRARGSEKSYKFLMRLLTNGGESEMFYPKDYIFKPSDGKWFIQRSLRVTDTRLNGNSDNTLATFALYTNRELRGQSSNTTAAVERVEQFYELGTLINEIFLSSISNTFISGEVVAASYYDESNTLVSLTSNIFSGLVTSIVINESGSGYSVGNPFTFTGGAGSGAAAVVSSVSTGNISSLLVVQGGSGYQANNLLLFSGGGGSGANGDVLTVNASGVFHPNTYNIDANQLSQIQGATWAAAQTIFARTTSNLALNVISSLASTFTYANCGPVTQVRVLAAGDGYTSIPAISVISNTVIAPLGILGSLIINNGGVGYTTGDELVFTNPPDGYGFGAKANVTTVNGTGAITDVRYYSTADNEIKGGLGYFDAYLPSITVTSAGGSGANITAVSQVASGADITPNTGTIGSILGVTITSGGQGYTTAPTATLPGYGDGEASFTTSVVQGIYTYPGYFLNQDGFPSSYNFLQDRDYWQNYSYVVRAGLAYEKWIQAVRDLLHPSGVRVWGEYSITDDTVPNDSANAQLGFSSNTTNSQYFIANAIYFNGSSYFRAVDETAWSSPSTGSIVLSTWFKMNQYLPNSNASMTLIDSTFTIANSSRFAVTIEKNAYSGNVANNSSGTDHYIKVHMANGTNHPSLSLRTDFERTPLVTNVWYHLVVSGNVAASNPTQGMWINNVNSCIVVARTANNTEKIWFNQMNLVSFGANSVGGNTFTGYMSEVWIRSYTDTYNPNDWTVRDDWLTAQLTPNSAIPGITSNGFGWSAATLPTIYLRGNTATGNTNSGSGSKSYAIITGNTVGLLPGPGHPSNYD